MTARSASALLRPIALGAMLLTMLSPTSRAQSTSGWADRLSVQARLGSEVVYDDVHERVLLFTRESEAWEWDGVDWKPLAASAALPATDPLGFYGPVAFDRQRGKVVFVPLFLSETWEFDGTSWVQCLPAHQPPSGIGHLLAYDSARGEVVLLGQGTWVWDGVDWVERLPATPGPGVGSRRIGFADMAYDAARQRILYVWRSETWEWDGLDWTQRAPAHSPAQGYDLGFDPGRARIVYALGSGSVAEWDGSDWSTVSVPSGPGTLTHGMQLCYDEVRQEMLQIGGALHAQSFGPLPAGPPPFAAETWSWDGTTWTLRHLGDGYEGARPDLSRDTTRRTLVSFVPHFLERTQTSSETYLGVTREWDGRAWRVRHISDPFSSTGYPSTGPVARVDADLVFDPRRSVTLLFGGTNGYGDTWEWDGMQWSSRSPAHSPSARHGHDMVDDAVRSRIVLFGGTANGTLFGDTWEWDGNDWSQVQLASAPSPRTGHAMVYDPLRQRTVLFGGSDASGPVRDTWEFDGLSWSLVPGPYSPPSGVDHAMAWDPVHRTIVIYSDDECWEYDGAWHWRQSGLPALRDGAMEWDVARNAMLVTTGATTRWIGDDVTNAQVQAQGQGCAGSAGVPHLFAAAPALGDAQVRLRLEHARSSAPVLFALSSSQQTIALGGGCSWFVGAAEVTSVAFSNSGGYAEVAIALPFDIALRGAQVWSQAAVLDPGTPITGAACSQALRLQVGDGTH